MTDFAEAIEAPELADRACWLYEEFSPEISPGKRGWGAVGELDLDHIRSLR